MEEAKSRIHPLMATAAVGVILLCLVAVAAMTGYLPGSNAQKADPQAMTQEQMRQQAQAQAQAPAPAARPAAAPQQHRTQVAAATQTAQARPHCADCGVVQD